MDNISTSTFELDQIRQAWKENILAGVGAEEGKEDGDIDVDGKGYRWCGECHILLSVFIQCPLHISKNGNITWFDYK